MSVDVVALVLMLVLVELAALVVSEVVLEALG